VWRYKLPRCRHRSRTRMLWTSTELMAQMRSGTGDRVSSRFPTERNKGEYLHIEPVSPCVSRSAYLKNRAPHEIRPKNTQSLVSERSTCRGVYFRGCRSHAKPGQK